MSQISRLHSTEITNGNLIDATHINNELNQLVSESNSQDTRLATTESNITNHTSSFKLLMTGLIVQYSTANRVIIKPGVARDSENIELMEVISDITVDISTSGVNGLDTGTEATSTWYYLWLIKNTSTGNVAGLLSTSSSTPTLPSGYNKKRLLPIAVRNDGSSNIIPFVIANGWPYRPQILYNVAFTDIGTAAGTTLVLNGGTATTFTAVALSSFVPPISKYAILNTIGQYTATNRSIFLRSTGVSHNGYSIRVTSSSPLIFIERELETNASQQVDYKIEGSGANLTMDVIGFIVTEV